MAKNLRILLAQGCGTCRLLVEKQLRLWALPFDSVANGEDALEHSLNHQYDLVLMDIQMPHMDGIEVTEQIRDFEKRNSFYHVPIIALTANALIDTVDRCKRAGMIDVIVKPYNAHDLRMMIYYYLGNVWKLRLLSESKRYESNTILQNSALT